MARTSTKRKSARNTAKSSSRQIAVRKERVQSTAMIIQQPRSMLELCMMASRDRSIDPQKMTQLIELQEREQMKVAEFEFTENLVKVQSELPRILPDRKNRHTQSRYASLDRISRAADPVLRKYGFTVQYGNEDSPIEGYVRVTGYLSRPSAMAQKTFTKKFQIDLPADKEGAKGNSNKNGVQAIGSTNAYGRRYIKMMMLDITISGEDNDAQNTRDVITDDQVTALRSAMKVRETDDGFERRMLDYYNIEELADIPAKAFRQAMHFVEKYIPPEAKTNAEARAQTQA